MWNDEHDAAAERPRQRVRLKRPRKPGADLMRAGLVVLALVIIASFFGD
ncbi:hypothetical protein IP92_01614 [Pseudoduganella flava]|uniref:Uncharacterized protein n=1 Tax=Pseudoduganella flava TaxID=871742 RepID=A0A562Q112_9BURK|nr:hypothetical protein [Pseudoduganella flava]QGZ38101.1 hypothetical protein GO485_02915 [Pseudoduganella flava]TWI50385.1 hypothetical protein IP92_01614 [Pseudoduganella flava]